MDKWLGTCDRVDILMGNFNERIWGESHKPTRWWHSKLADGSLQDPAMAVVDDVSLIGLITYNRGQRLDTIVVSSDAWRICIREAYYTLDF